MKVFSARFCRHGKAKGKNRSRQSKCLKLSFRWVRITFPVKLEAGMQCCNANSRRKNAANVVLNVDLALLAHRQNKFPDGWKYSSPPSAKYGIMKDRNLPMDHQKAQRLLFVFPQNTFVLQPQRRCQSWKKIVFLLKKNVAFFVSSVKIKLPSLTLSSWVKVASPCYVNVWSCAFFLSSQIAQLWSLMLLNRCFAVFVLISLWGCK